MSLEGKGTWLCQEVRPEMAPAICLPLARYWPEGPRRLWTRPGLAELLGVHLCTIQRWEWAGIIEPITDDPLAIRPGERPRNRRVCFGVLEAAAAAMARDLIRLGVKRRLLRGLGETMTIGGVNRRLGR